MSKIDKKRKFCFKNNDSVKKIKITEYSSKIKTVKFESVYFDEKDHYLSSPWNCVWSSRNSKEEYSS